MWGLSHPRLDRLQDLPYYASQTPTNVLFDVGNIISFDHSRQIFVRLSALWNGRVVYQRHWHTFLQELRSEWLRAVALVSCESVATILLLIELELEYGHHYVRTSAAYCGSTMTHLLT